jgi:hypothetical protein
MWRILRVVVFLIAGCTVGYSQASKSPLSSQGIGDISDLSMVHNEGMGGLGISFGSFWYMNSINPALLPLNSLTVFQAGFATERRSIFTEESSSVNNGGNLSYIATSFPIIGGRWTSAVGLAPYSTVEYKFSSRNPVAGAPGESALANEGTGGFNQFYWSNGVRLGDSFFLGARASYLFSSITEQSTSVALDTNMVSRFQAAIFDRVSVSDFKFTAGAVFIKDSIFNNRININVGVLYDFAGEINARQFRTLERRALLGTALESDTLINNEEGSVYLPSAYGFGVTFSRTFHWSVGLEMKMQNWSQFKNFDGVNENLSDGLRIALGGEYIPDYAAVSNYFKRISYRTGFSYELLPYTVNLPNSSNNNNQFKEVGINFGLSLPVGRYSSVDLATRYARRGDISETNIEEEVLRFSLGISFNDQWFIRRKYD